MKNREVKDILRKAKTVLEIEAEGILGIIDKLGPEFAKAIETILKAEGRVIVTGVGKSGIVGRKIVATLNSTGTPALFLHPVEAMHGDLGMVTKKDVILAISNSGETGEITILIPSFKRLGAPLIAFTGNLNSTLAKYSDIAIYTGVKREACPLGLAPTASTTATLAMGDALAVVLLEKRRFTKEDFYRFHPAGQLGKRLGPKAKDVMQTLENLIIIKPSTRIKEIIPLLAENEILWVVKRKKLQGVVYNKLSDIFLKKEKMQKINAQKICVPVESISLNTSASDALKIMQQKELDVMAVIDEKGFFVGALFLKDLIKKATFSFT